MKQKTSKKIERLINRDFYRTACPICGGHQNMVDSMNQILDIHFPHEKWWVLIPEPMSKKVIFKVPVVAFGRVHEIFYDPDSEEGKKEHLTDQDVNCKIDYYPLIDSRWGTGELEPVITHNGLLRDGEEWDKEGNILFEYREKVAGSSE